MKRLSSTGQKIKIKQRDKEYYEGLYEKIRLIDKDISEFEKQVIILKDEEKPKILSFKFFKRFFESEKLNPLINTFRRDIWDLKIKRKKLKDLFSARDKEDDDVIILDVKDIIHYVSWLDNDNATGIHTSKIVSIISKLKIHSSNVEYSKLAEIKQYFLEKYNLEGGIDNESNSTGLYLF